MVYSERASSFIGTLDNAAFKGIFDKPTVQFAYNPSITNGTTMNNLMVQGSTAESLIGKLSAVYNSMYAAVTAVLMTGAIAERGRLIPTSIFVFVWATIVYAPIACWSWNPNGWAVKLGYLDWAGGTPVHIVAGYSALAYSLALGSRGGMGLTFNSAFSRSIYKIQTLWGKSKKNHSKSSSDPDQLSTPEFHVAYNSRPQSTLLVVLGSGLMWAGWIGFNGGASIVPTLRTVQTVLNTNISASFGGIAWAVLDYRNFQKWSVIGFCSGVVCGLVSITPGAGFVPAWAAIIFGLCGGAFSNLATKIKFLIGIDDSLDIFAVHGVCGVIGNILTALFASKNIANLDSMTIIDGGWLDKHYKQLWFQIAGTLASSFYAFFVTLIILLVIDKIPYLQLRVSKEDEINGLDLSEHDEFAYDYVEFNRDLSSNQDHFSLPDTEMHGSRNSLSRSNTENLHETNSIINSNESHVNIPMSELHGTNAMYNIDDPSHNAYIHKQVSHSENFDLAEKGLSSNSSVSPTDDNISQEISNRDPVSFRRSSILDTNTNSWNFDQDEKYFTKRNELNPNFK